MLNPNEFTFKEAIIKLHELMGDTTIVLEYEELPEKEIVLTIQEKEDINEY